MRGVGSENGLAKFFSTEAGGTPSQDFVFTAFYVEEKHMKRDHMWFGARANMSRQPSSTWTRTRAPPPVAKIDNPLPCSCRHEQGRGLGSVRQVQFWTPQNSDLAGFQNFKFSSYASMLHMVFTGSLGRKKLGKSVCFFTFMQIGLTLREK